MAICYIIQPTCWHKLVVSADPQGFTVKHQTRCWHLNLFVFMPFSV
jgi:hypothetical protein